jgi:hypothetical protein
LSWHLQAGAHAPPNGASGHSALFRAALSRFGEKCPAFAPECLAAKQHRVWAQN